jgi:hypothetical protein
MKMNVEGKFRGLNNYLKSAAKLSHNMSNLYHLEGMMSLTEINLKENRLVYKGKPYEIPTEIVKYLHTILKVGLKITHNEFREAHLNAFGREGNPDNPQVFFRRAKKEIMDRFPIKDLLWDKSIRSPYYSQGTKSKDWIIYFDYITCDPSFVSTTEQITNSVGVIGKNQANLEGAKIELLTPPPSPSAPRRTCL